MTLARAFRIPIRLGERMTIEEQESRAQIYVRAKKVAHAAAEMSDPERLEFLDTETLGDPQLREEVLWMLAALDATRTLAMPLPDLPPSDLSGADAAVAAPVRYRIVRKLGAGGMGVVYLAARNDSDLGQQIALKLLNATAGSSSELVERFGRERRMLATLEHPGIARLIDGGLLDDGRPFLAMEYVEGERIDTWCDQHALGLRERIRLFLQVCTAVEYAHRRLIIHRDLKPANILVTNSGQSKLLDFGIASAIGDDGASVEQPTSSECRALTLAYASPEHVENRELTTAADVYSLGVVLYQLISGKRPYQELGSPLELSNAIVEGRVPAPSRVAVPVPGIGRAGRRGAIPADIDAIVLKALRPAVEQRYATVAELAADLEAFLERRPVAALRGRHLYRVRRFIGRNRWGVAGATLAAVGLLAGMAGLQLALAESRARQVESEVRGRELEQIVHFQRSMLESIDVEAMGYGILAAHAERVTALLDADARAGLVTPEVAATASSWLEAAGVRLSPADLARDAIDEHVVGHALALLPQGFAGAPHIEADVRQSLARVLIAMGKYPEAIAELHRVLEMRQSGHVEDATQVLTTRVDLGNALRYAGELEEAEQEFLAVEVGMVPGVDPKVLQLAAMGKARVLADRGDYAGALAIQEPLYGSLKADDPARSLQVRRDLASTLIRMGRRAEALGHVDLLIEQYAEAYGAEHAETLEAMSVRADLLNRLNEYERSLELAREVVALRERRLGLDHPKTLQDMDMVAANLVRLDHLDEAHPLLERVIEGRRQALGEDHPHTLQSMAHMIRLLAKRDDVAGAIALQRRAYESSRRSLGDTHPDTLFAGGGLASLLRRAGQYGEARRRMEAVYRHQSEVMGPEHPLTIAGLDLLGWIESDAGELGRARELYTRALEARARTLGVQDAHTIESASALYTVLARLGDSVAAMQVRRRHLDPLIARAPETLNASMRSVRDEAILAIGEAAPQGSGAH